MLCLPYAGFFKRIFKSLQSFVYTTDIPCFRLTWRLFSLAALCLSCQWQKKLWTIIRVINLFTIIQIIKCSYFYINLTWRLLLVADHKKGTHLGTAIMTERLALTQWNFVCAILNTIWIIQKFLIQTISNPRGHPNITTGWTFTNNCVFNT